MPLYEYACKKCRKHTERIEKFSGPFLKKCPHCGGRLERIQSAPAIQFKGSGWYVTDYAKSKTPPAGDSGKSATAAPAEKSESKSDTKKPGPSKEQKRPAAKEK